MNAKKAIWWQLFHRIFCYNSTVIVQLCSISGESGGRGLCPKLLACRGVRGHCLIGKAELA